MPYGADVKMTEKKGLHMYSADDKTYPSVTTILDCIGAPKNLMGWANSLGKRGITYEEELKRTAVQGTFVHEINQCLVDPEHGIMPTITDPLVDYYVRKRVQNFKFQLDQNAGHWKTIFSECPFVSHKYEIGGTMDWFSEWYELKTLFDYKTSAAVRAKHILQLGGYYLILQDNGIDMDRAGIILCKQDRCLINIFEMEVIKRCAEIFLRIRDYYYDHLFLEDAVVNKATII